MLFEDVRPRTIVLFIQAKPPEATKVHAGTDCRAAAPWKFNSISYHLDHLAHHTEPGHPSHQGLPAYVGGRAPEAKIS